MKYSINAIWSQSHLNEMIADDMDDVLNGKHQQKNWKKRDTKYNNPKEKEKKKEDPLTVPCLNSKV